MYFKYFFIEFITNSHILCKLFLTTPQQVAALDRTCRGPVTPGREIETERERDRY